MYNDRFSRVVLKHPTLGNLLGKVGSMASYMSNRKHSVFVYSDRVVLFGGLQSHPPHHHAFIQLFIHDAGTGQDSEIQIIDSNSEHGLDEQGGRYFSVLIDPGSSTGERLRKRFFPVDSKSEGNIPAVARIPFRDARDFLNQVNSQVSSVEVHAESEKLISLLGCTSKHMSRSGDSRVDAVIERIQQSELGGVPAVKIAAQIGLSESRFYYVFKRETGVTYRNYLLMLKLIRGIQNLQTGMSFTEAAHSAGFADSAHFSRTFKTNTGISLSEIFKNKRFVQVFFDTGIYPRFYEH